MKTLGEIDLSIAEGVFAVSNTPLFLIRKLRANPAVQEIGLTFDGHDILQALKASAGVKPATLTEAVRPYAYLVALSLNRDISYLKEAAKIPAKHFDWFQYVVNVLIETYRPTSFQKIHAPGQLIMPQTSSKPDASVSRRIIIVEN